MTAKKLATVRAQIEKLVDERDDIEGAAITRQEAEANIAALIGAPYLGNLHQGRIDLDPSPSGLLNGTFNSSSLLKMLERPGVLRAMFPDALAKYLLSIYDKKLGDRKPGLPAGERRKKLSELAAQIFQLEVDEESLIEEIESDGGDVLRRGDASPHAQLGFDPPRAAA